MTCSQTSLPQPRLTICTCSAASRSYHRKGCGWNPKGIVCTPAPTRTTASTRGFGIQRRNRAPAVLPLRPPLFPEDTLSAAYRETTPPLGMQKGHLATPYHLRAGGGRPWPHLISPAGAAAGGSWRGSHVPTLETTPRVSGSV